MNKSAVTNQAPTLSYGIRADYTTRAQPEYFHDVRQDKKNWQPDVYAIAAHYARVLGAKRLIDVGCGRGLSIAPYTGEFQVTGVDFGGNLDYCRTAYDYGQWVECNLEDNTPDIDCETLKDAVVICSDVIEHLRNPERLILTLSMFAVCASLVILSTPDRERVYGHDHSGPPGNVSHIREWTLGELTRWVSGYPLRVQWRGWTLNNDTDRQLSTSLLLLTRPEICYDMSSIEKLFQVEGNNGYS